MKLSILMPSHNEEKSIKDTIREVYNVLKRNNIQHEILVVNDNSSDSTKDILDKLSMEIPTLRYITNSGSRGYGLAVRLGLQNIKGNAVCIMMADGSDSPDDLLKYYNGLMDGYDCVFGSRFTKASQLIDYPIHKLILNRLGNYFIKILLGIKHNNITNAFKCYKKEVIMGIQPLFSNHFNLTVELPLKAIIRGYNFATVPIKWVNRTHGISKFKIKEIGSRYLFIIFYIFLEKHLSRGDYLRK
ncbi:MAG: glycosyltransferase family 2 protein [Candidatus Omnitrophica bacterium]|nr:glycosyltransferase family 2 protein [Candidatus Omnitrophota bacterium]